MVLPAFLIPLIAGLGIGAATGGQPLQNGLTYGLNSLFANTILQPGELIDLHHRDAITEATYYELMRYQGYDEKTAIAYYYTKDSLLTPEQVASWRISEGLELLRKWDTEDTPILEQAQDSIELQRIYAVLMKQNGYRGLVASEFWEANRPLPSFSTILEWLAKEVFEPEKQAKFRLNEPAPPQLVSYMAAYNVPAAEAQQYWSSHWLTIGRAAWDRMYQRFNVNRNTDTYSDIDPEEILETGKTWDELKISSTDYEDYYTILELSPYFSDRGQGDVYNPMPFTLLQQLWQYGILTYDLMIGRLRDYGYSKRTSQLILAAWQRKFPFGGKEPLRDNITKKYKLRQITRAAALVELVAAGGTDDANAFLLDNIDDEIEEKLKILKIKSLTRTAYSQTMSEAQLIAKIQIIIPEETTERKELVKLEIQSGIAEKALRIATRLGGKALGQNALSAAEFRVFLRSKFVSDSDIEIAIKAYMPAGQSPN